MRPNNRGYDQVRDIKITRNYTKYAEGSVLVEFGDTKVVCNATVENKVPLFLRGKDHGWVTAEYAMLPRATGTRTQRESAKGKQTGRSMEIQRLIGRSLRAIVDLTKLKEYSILVDCDVLQADGGTRTAAISGACVALYDAITYMLTNNLIKENPLISMVAAVSVGIVAGQAVCDLEYIEDSNADTDMNVVMTDQGKIIEVQGTAEQEPFSRDELLQLLDLASSGVQQIIRQQKRSLSLL